MIQVNNLTFEYPDKRALTNVSFTVKEGTITALVGPNGSGKTTLLRCLAALSKPLKGNVLINNFHTINQPHFVHQQVGYLQDLFGLYDQLTVAQSMQFNAYSRLPKEMDVNAVNNAVIIAAERAGITGFMQYRIKSLSRGMRQRVGIAQAIVHKPKVLLLDEPASGLDPEARYALSNLLLDLCKSDMTIIVSSHILAELEDYSTEMLVIQDGKMIEHRTLKQDSNFVKLVNIDIAFSQAAAQYLHQLNAINGIQQLKVNGNKVHLELDDTILSKAQLLKTLVSMDIPVEEFGELKMNLQDEYIKTLSNYKQSKV